MKKLLTILCLVLLVSCSNEVPSDKLVERGDITYETNSTTPFTGSSVSYHDNGQLEMRGNYKDGKDDGLWEGYYENGQLSVKGNYKDGELHGLYESFHKNGQLNVRRNYKDGKEDGLEEFFREEDGSFWFKNCYKNNEKVDMSYCED